MKTLPLAVSLALFALSAKADVPAGIRAYNAGDYETARKEFSAAAETKDPEGLHLLAALYYQGQGVPKDLAKAAALFTEAAGKGYRASQANLGLMYHRGDGVKQDVGKAIEYYTAAGRQGDLQSAFNLGQIFRKGEGGERNYDKALAYYKFAALRGHLPSANELGLMFAQGQGVEVDYIEAYGWIHQSAEAKDPQALKNHAQLKQILGAKLAQAELRAKEIKKLIETESQPRPPE